jgi:hypothetical protein
MQIKQAKNLYCTVDYSNDILFFSYVRSFFLHCNCNIVSAMKMRSFYRPAPLNDMVWLMAAQTPIFFRKVLRTLRYLF